MLTYRRKKTGQLLTVEWTRQMQAIMDKYPINPTQYLLPLILREDGSERRQYQNQMMKINRHLKEVASLIKLPVSLSLYYSRHSWATIARGKDIPLSVISEALGHDSEITTQIYLDSIKSVEVDKANRKILKDL
ncbi:integrase family protein [Phocaeicola plebeius CAG:211]|uniref:Integrase family protein n=1 Tax=Phocaeicola plebeius CAG:211 TaxID=1263052 RepID=R5V881_9BACT|nr:tyrosine-type recombinase/integrase [Phocaeicola plebeius]CCZ86793.1 integrase family protein [Phocaeicola plebeius CAG:211]